MTLAAVPDPLLAPLLDAAADVLRGLTADEVPAALRALSAFDRRGLTSSAARRQLRRTFDLDEAFRVRVVTAFTIRPEVRAALDAWSAEAASAAAAEAVERDDLELLASALYAARPEGVEYALGVVCTED